MSKRYGQHCPIARTLDVVGERWSMLIVRELLLGPMRFTDLLTTLPGMGTRMLTERLKHLVEEGVVVSRELPPPASTTAYTLTARGYALGPVLHALATWGMPLLESSKRGDRREPATAARMLWHRAARTRRRSLGEVQLTIGGAPFVFSAKNGLVRARRGEADSPDGTAAIATTDAFALLEGGLDVERAVASGKLVLAGKLSAELFRDTFDFGAG